MTKSRAFGSGLSREGLTGTGSTKQRRINGRERVQWLSYEAGITCLMNRQGMGKVWGSQSKLSDG